MVIHVVIDILMLLSPKVVIFSVSSLFPTVAFPANFDTENHYDQKKDGFYTSYQNSFLTLLIYNGHVMQCHVY